jgi:hypothetical protein
MGYSGRIVVARTGGGPYTGAGAPALFEQGLGAGWRCRVDASERWAAAEQPSGASGSSR